MKYWLIPLLVCAGAAQANAQQAGGIGGAGGLFVLTPNFIGTNFHSKPVSVTAGAGVGPNNNLDVQQNSLVNAVGVQQIATGKGNNLSNNANVVQSGQANYVGLGQQNLGKPGSTQTNSAGVGQFGPQSTTVLSQNIGSLPSLPSGAP